MLIQTFTITIIIIIINITTATAIIIISIILIIIINIIITILIIIIIINIISTSSSSLIANIFVFFVVEAVGCYKDLSARAIPDLLKSFRGQIDWYNIGKTIANCANAAQEKGYKVSWCNDRSTRFSLEINFDLGSSNLHECFLTPSYNY